MTNILNKELDDNLNQNLNQNLDEIVTSLKRKKLYRYAESVSKFIADKNYRDSNLMDSLVNDTFISDVNLIKLYKILGQDLLTYISKYAYGYVGIFKLVPIVRYLYENKIFNIKIEDELFEKFLFVHMDKYIIQYEIANSCSLFTNYNRFSSLVIHYWGGSFSNHSYFEKIITNNIDFLVRHMKENILLWISQTLYMIGYKRHMGIICDAPKTIRKIILKNLPFDKKVVDLFRFHFNDRKYMLSLISYIGIIDDISNLLTCRDTKQYKYLLHNKIDNLFVTQIRLRKSKRDIKILLNYGIIKPARNYALEPLNMWKLHFMRSLVYSKNLDRVLLNTK